MDIKEHFLANFADGDSWEEANALTLTKHGGLAVASYFYELAVNECIATTINNSTPNSDQMKAVRAMRALLPTNT